MKKPCGESLMPGAAAAFAGSVAAVVVGMARSGAVFMSRFPGTRRRHARFGHVRVVARGGGPISMVGEDVEPQSQPARRMVAERRAFTQMAGW
jgi:hypothetical protein